MTFEGAFQLKLLMTDSIALSLLIRGPVGTFSLLCDSHVHGLMRTCLGPNSLLYAQTL